MPESFLPCCRLPLWIGLALLLAGAGLGLACESTAALDGAAPSDGGAAAESRSPAVNEPGATDDALEDEESAEVLDRVTGQVVKVGNFGFGLVPDDAPGTRYAPVEPLAEDFQVDGLKVRFSGEVGDPDDIPGRGRGGRRWGTPLTVTHIEKVDGDGRS